MEEKIETKKSSIFLIVLALIVLVILAGIWWAKKTVTPVPTPKVEKIPPKEDSVAAINQDLQGVEILDLEKEFQEIDQDLNSL